MVIPAAVAVDARRSRPLRRIHQRSQGSPNPFPPHFTAYPSPFDSNANSGKSKPDRRNTALGFDPRSVPDETISGIHLGPKVIESRPLQPIQERVIGLFGGGIRRQTDGRYPRSAYQQEPVSEGHGQILPIHPPRPIHSVSPLDPPPQKKTALDGIHRGDPSVSDAKLETDSIP